MLSTFLSQLQTYFSKYFLIGSFSPMLAFAFVNGGLAYFVFDPWRVWADTNILNATVAGGAFLTTSIVVGIVLLAYVLSALSTFLRQQLEGKSWGRFARHFVPAQNARRLALIDARDEAYQEMADLKEADEWEAMLLTARADGSAKHPGKAFVPKWPDAVANTLDKLEDQRRRDGIVTAADLSELAELIAYRLENHDVARSTELDRQHKRLAALIDYATASYSAEGVRGRHARLQNELNSNFGADVAPTKMGNVANTIQSYAMRRYRCNLEIVWSNLLQVVQKDAAAQATLQEAKTQLDFLVASCWLSLVTAAIWSFVFFGVAPSRLGFVLSALAGPFIAYLWYRAAAEQYRSFADVAMTMLDTFRFDLLRTMRLRVPADVEDERYTWATFDRLVTFGEEGNFRYAPGAENGDKPQSAAAEPEPAKEPKSEPDPAPDPEPAPAGDNPKTKPQK